MPVRILAIGDLHLGRRPSRVPAAVDPAGRLTPAAAWAMCVERAVREGADAVVLAGDVVEDSDDLYEAFPDLRRGVERLADHNIPVAAVSGNHDGAVLPRLAESLPAFRLIGQGGTWEAIELAGVEILGWSFPGTTAPDSPLATPVPQRGGNQPRIGLLHCDRDQTGSRYAPVRSADLQAADSDAWLLGHIHRPDALAGPRPIGYLGSVLGLDPGEPGARGPWWIRVDGPGHIEAEHIPLAPLRWEPLTVNADGVEHADDLHPRVMAALDELHLALSRSGAEPQAVGCRLQITGRPSAGIAIEARLQETGLAELHEVRDGVHYFIEAVRMATEPALDLERLAQGSDPVGLLARRLLILRRDPGDRERAELIRRARPELEAVTRQRTYWGLEPSDLGEARIAEVLEQAARRALEHLLTQDRETAP
ncbi:metallophosphoesterase family protein [Halorhodospira halophila]|uniref:Metallophosphoesterase n=1 Tax=Halorhodospira halophila (strain DSM 244 / SL1) TaxID=349124 RepID=A1WXR2_HALHL|nr:DNA repair exonuclease [Halorhodospira halophila]ABM62474.1 metallophosphoesterase [Halorhodospira halophila SL1]